MSKANYTKLLTECLQVEKDGNIQNLKQMLLNMIAETDAASNNKKNNVKDLQKAILAYLKKSEKLNKNTRPMLCKANIKDDKLELCNGYTAIILNNSNIQGLPIVTEGAFPNIKEIIKNDNLKQLEYTLDMIEISRKLALKKIDKVNNIVNSLFIDCKYIDAELLHPIIKMLGTDVILYGDGKETTPLYLESEIGKAVVLPWKPKNNG